MEATNRMYIDFAVNKQSIKRTDNNKIVSGSENYLYARFTFTEDWTGIIKTAVFKSGNKAFNVILDDNGECIVLWEVITDGAYVFVSVFGGDLIMATECKEFVHSSGYVPGETPEPPTPDVYVQIMEKLESISSGQIDSAAVEKAVNDYMTAHPVNVPTEQDITDIVQSYVEAHKEELQGESGKTPVKGVNYWTEAEKQERQCYINEQIGGALNGSY